MMFTKIIKMMFQNEDIKREFTLSALLNDSKLANFMQSLTECIQFAN